MSAFEKAPQPNTCPGGYSLDLYCDRINPAHRYDDFPWGVVQFQTYGQSAAWARRQGWVLHRDGTATCPKCSGRAALSKEPT